MVQSAPVWTQLCNQEPTKVSKMPTFSHIQAHAPLEFLNNFENSSRLDTNRPDGT